MSPLLETLGNATVYSFGEFKGSGEKFFIAVAKSSGNSAGISVASDPISKTVYWSLQDTSANMWWYSINSAGVATFGNYIPTNTYSAQMGSIDVDSSGNVIVSAVDFATGTFSGSLQKIAPGGTKLWGRKISTQGSNSLNFVQDGSGNIYGVSLTQGTFGAGNTQFGVVKYNSSGTLSYWNNYAGASPNGGYNAVGGSSIAVNSAGTAVYIAGTVNNSTNQADTLIKTNGSGVVQWTATYSSSAGSQPVNALDSSENSYLAYNGGVWHLAKFNVSGTWQWDRTISAQYVGLSCDSAGNVFGLFSGSNTLYVVKWNSSGVIQWQRSITRTGGNILAQPLGGWKTLGFHVTATSIVFTAQDTNYGILFKLPNDGSLTGSYTVNGFTYVYAASSLTEAAGANYFSTITTAGSSVGADSASTTNVYSGLSNTVVTKVIP